MSLQLVIGRPKVSKKLFGAFFAIFALFVQPLVALNIPEAFATGANITTATYESKDDSVEVNADSNKFSVRLKNSTNTNESVSSSATLHVTSTSSTGRFAATTAYSYGATNSADITISNGTSLGSFYYKDTTPGSYIIKAEVSGGGINGTISKETTVEVTAVPVATPTIVSLNATLHNQADYKGIAVDSDFKDLNNVTAVSITVNRQDGTTVTKTGKQFLIDYMNAQHDFPLTTPIVIQNGTYNEAASQAWNPAPGSWKASTAPQSVTLTLTLSDSSTVTKNVVVVNGSTTYQAITPVATSVTVCTAGCDYTSLQEAIDAVATGGTVEINSDLPVEAKVDITKTITINGNGHTITAGAGVTNSVLSSSNKSAIVVSNLTIDGNSVFAHGINVFKGSMTLNNVTTKNAGKFGLLVNGADVTVTNLATANNGYGGVNVDQSSTSNPAKLTANGTSTHTDAGADIYIDDVTKPVSVVDTNAQYNITNVGTNGRAYKLKPAPDTTKPNVYFQLSIDGKVLNGDVHARSRLTNETGPVTRVTYIDNVEIKNETNTSRNSEIKFNTEDYSDGQHTLRVVATDQAGNSKEISETFTVDNKKPIVKVNLNRASYVNSGDSVRSAANPEIEATDAHLDRVELWKGNAVMTSWDANSTSRRANISWLGEGTYTIRAYDSVGLVSDVFTITIDNTRPTPAPTTISPSGFSSTNDVTFKWTQPTDPNSGVVTYEVITGKHPNVDTDGKMTTNVQTLAANVSGESYTENNMAEGPYFWQVRAKDAAGNYSEWSNVGVLQVDSKGPTSAADLESLIRGTVTITQTIDDAYPKSGKLRIWKLNENGTQDNTKFFSIGDKNVESGKKVTYTLDTIANLYGDGTYRAKFTSTDIFDRTDTYTKEFVVDNTSPTGEVVVPTASAQSVTVTLQTSEPIQDLGGDWTEVDSRTYTKNHTQNGSFTVSFRDIIGNSGSASYNVTAVDNTAPTVLINDAIRLSNGSYLITGTTSSSSDIVLVSVNGSNPRKALVSGQTWSFRTTVLEDGAYVAAVTSTDIAGNTNPQGATFPFRATTPSPTRIGEGNNDSGSTLAANRLNTIASINGANQAGTGLLGNGVATDSEAADNSDNDGQVLGTQDSKMNDTLAAIAPSANGWKLFGIAWYWWLLLLAAIAAIWWFIAGYRRRNSESA